MMSTYYIIEYNPSVNNNVIMRPPLLRTGPPSESISWDLIYNTECLYLQLKNKGYHSLVELGVSLPAGSDGHDIFEYL